MCVCVCMNDRNLSFVGDELTHTVCHIINIRYCNNNNKQKIWECLLTRKFCLKPTVAMSLVCACVCLCFYATYIALNLMSKTGSLTGEHSIKALNE